MGLRDLFRSKSNTPNTPQPSPGAPANDPRAQETDPRAQGIQNADKSGQAVPETNAPQQRDVNDRNDHANAADNDHLVGHDGRATDATPSVNSTQGTDARGTEQQQLPESGPLRNLVDILLSRGADRARLTLVQSGNVMTHQTRQAHGEAQDEVENGTVDQGSPLFDDVADLYTQAMNTPVGPWRQLDLAVAPEQNGQRLVTVDYAFPSGQSRKESYVQGRACPAAAPTRLTPVTMFVRTLDTTTPLRVPPSPTVAWTAPRVMTMRLGTTHPTARIARRTHAPKTVAPTMCVRMRHALTVMRRRRPALAWRARVSVRQREPVWLRD
ncbi:hypothetical protein [Kocuria atrinae]|uniref:hypothetical protein n=1 Tax=Kocuria atrinae TaxID=592377 RepID=UPI000306C31F|nr:hypothetical protein [Kocuria atrinae]